MYAYPIYLQRIYPSLLSVSMKHYVYFSFDFHVIPPEPGPVTDVVMGKVEIHSGKTFLSTSFVSIAVLGERQ